MKRVLITGTNGMIGRLILEACLQREDVSSITSITRKPVGISHPKLIEVIHADFLELSKIENVFTDQDICFYCIGVYTGTVPREEFRKITVDYTRSIAETLKRNSPEASFVFLSGQGADLSEKSLVMFAKDKGAAENILMRLHFARLCIFRPGYIYPVTPRKEPNKRYYLFRRLYKPLSIIYPNLGLTSTQLANAMIKAGFGAGNQVIYENREIKQLANE